MKSSESALARQPLAWRSIIERYALLALVIAEFLVFALNPVSGDIFVSALNLRTLIANQGVALMIAVALVFPLAAGIFDFSVGAVAASSSVVAGAAIVNFGLPVPVAVALGVVFGSIVGCLLGLMIAYGGVNPFIATLGVATLIGGGIFAYTGGLRITGIPPEWTDLGSRDWFGIPRIVIVAGVIAFVAWWLLSQTVFGRRLFAIGSNARATQLLGADVKRIQLLAFVASGTLAGIGGVLLLARNGGATSDNGMMMLFPALTAVLLSTIVIDIGRPSVPGVVIAILFIAITVSGLTLIGTPSWVNQMFNGAALLIAVGVARLAKQRTGTAPRRA
ncbi:ribose transport system permease protein [Homoserinimonas aerilata]|uniref:Ribose transport system permease protein n=1 Tax=Homoserinimonas aerilata TaxID=1162970 RepID=A0A542YH80_9MICO|nr:ABC transporter permease [Homoserinimonas aerilata]TQL47460.1 ribose transport system permease protein [Homoserinimonas aerilata]